MQEIRSGVYSTAICSRPFHYSIARVPNQTMHSALFVPSY